MRANEGEPSVLGSDKNDSDDSGHRRSIRFRLSASTDTCYTSKHTELKCRPTRDAQRTLSRLTHDAEHGTLTHDDPPILATSDQASKAAIRQSRCRESPSSLRVLGAQLQPADMYHSVQVGPGPGSILSRLPIMTSSLVPRGLLSPMHINLIVRVMLRRIHRVGSPEMYPVLYIHFSRGADDFDDRCHRSLLGEIDPRLLFRRRRGASTLPVRHAPPAYGKSSSP
ncbi:hypothetical protein OH76DRAFT_1555390, partial [Lentinus brumalis]